LDLGPITTATAERENDGKLDDRRFGRGGGNDGRLECWKDGKEKWKIGKMED
jgi:hypothetical protein